MKHFPQGFYVPSLVNIGPLLGEEAINVFSLFGYYLTLTKGVTLYLYSLNCLDLGMLHFNYGRTFLCESEEVDM